MEPWVAVRLGVSANQVTLASLTAGLAGAGAIATGDCLGFVLGVALRASSLLARSRRRPGCSVARDRSLDGVIYMTNYDAPRGQHDAGLRLGFRARCPDGLPCVGGGRLCNCAGRAC